MFSPVTLDPESTILKFGYSPDTLTKGMYKLVCVTCDNCHRKMDRPFINHKRLHQCPVVEGSNKKCFKCGEWKDLSLFNKNPSTSGGVAKVCRSCHNSYASVIKCEKDRLLKKQRSFDEDFLYWIRNRSYYIKNNSKRRGISCDIDEEYLRTQWELQEGKCFYSNLKMKAEPRVNGFQSWITPSLDRKDPVLGYTKGNVVWTCSCVNSFKNTMTDTEFFELLKTIKWNTNGK